MLKARNTRAYGRLTRFDRSTIEEGLKAKKSVRKIALILGRSPSSVAHEIKVNRTYMGGDKRGCLVGEMPEAGCIKLLCSPGVCNVCPYYHHVCSYSPKVEYVAARADRFAHERRSSARRGIDRSESSLAMALSVIRSDVARGLSPTQIAQARKDELHVSQSSIYRWITKGYAGMSDLELRRKVGYRPRRKSGTIKATPHGKERSYEEFVSLGEERCECACEADTVIGTKYDTQCILTLYLRPSRFQMMLLLSDKTSSAVGAALDSLEKALHTDLFSKLFGLILTDNGQEFSNTETLERSLSESDPRTQVYYCDVRQSQQKARCERNHVEIRKLVPKRMKFRFDDFVEQDMAYLMSQVNSIPRPSLGGLCPIELFCAQYKKDAELLLAAYGIRYIPYEKLDLTEQSLNNDRRRRGDDPLIPA